MEENKYLNEKNYQKAERAITLLAILILIIGFSIGGFLIYKGVAKPNLAKVDELKIKLENKRQELENKGLRFSAFTKYTDGEAYDLKIITNALDPSFNHCFSDEYKNNSLTKEYCKAKNSTGEEATSLKIVFGVFICIISCMVSGIMFMGVNARKINAFQVQQAMPIAKEGLEEMAPVIGKVGATIAKETAPAYGEIAKEISKGIKEGLKEDKKSK